MASVQTHQACDLPREERAMSASSLVQNRLEPGRRMSVQQTPWDRPSGGKQCLVSGESMSMSPHCRRFLGLAPRASTSESRPIRREVARSPLRKACICSEGQVSRIDLRNVSGVSKKREQSLSGHCQDKFLWSDASQTLPTGPNTQQSCDMPPHPVLRLVDWAGAEYNTLTMHSSHLCPRSLPSPSRSARTTTRKSTTMRSCKDQAPCGCDGGEQSWN
jgi:hypothetical protein